MSILDDIQAERDHQEKKWGEQNHHPNKWLVILGEEYGEACSAALQESELGYRTELIHVAAVAIAAIESLERGKWQDD